MWHSVALLGVLAGLTLIVAVGIATGTYNGLSLVGTLVLTASAVWDGYIIRDAREHVRNLREDTHGPRR
jgi:hypothetical protein